MSSLIFKNIDAFKLLDEQAEHSVELICVDLPYGTTQNKWDSVLPFKEMWEKFYRVLKPTGVIVLTASQPFTSLLVASNIDGFKYEIIWEKTVGSGQLNIKRQPLKVHESILVFHSSSKSTYNEQKTTGAKPYSITRKNAKSEGCYGKQESSSKVSSGERHAKSVIKISNPRIKGGHPTQKPTELMEYIIKTFSNRGDTVLDCCSGSGSTGEAALLTGRNFIGSELDKEYFKKANTRLKKAAKNGK